MDDNRLTLIAEDAADLPPLSALLQDAIIGVEDVAFDRHGRKLIMLASRYRWEASGLSRVRTGLRIGGVLELTRRRWPRAGVLDLLTITLDGEALLLAFAGGGALRVTVECIDIVMEDLSAPWPVKHRPEHD